MASRCNRANQAGAFAAVGRSVHLASRECITQSIVMWLLLDRLDAARWVWILFWVTSIPCVLFLLWISIRTSMREQPGA